MGNHCEQQVSVDHRKEDAQDSRKKIETEGPASQNKAADRRL
jgi:hypothetical protein